MKVTYSPEDGQSKTWDYKPRLVRQSTAEILERRSGQTFDEFNKSLLTGAARSRKVILYWGMLQDHPVYRWEDMPDFRMADVTVEFDANELGDLRAAVEQDKSMDEASKAAALEALDAEIAKAAPADPKAD